MIDEKTMLKLREAKAIIEKDFKNINGVAIGYKFKKGTNTKEPAVIVFVDNKKTYLALPDEERIPSAVMLADGDYVPTDVQVGSFRLEELDTETITPPLVGRRRPLVPGFSIGHGKITAGTLGCFLRDDRDGSLVGLSNNHVLANCNDSKLGDLIYQPGIADGGDYLDVVGSLKRFIRVEAGASTCVLSNVVCKTFNVASSILGRRSRLNAVTTGRNSVDAAIFTPSLPFRADIPNIGVPSGVMEGNLGMAIHKVGRTTGHTSGEIVAVEATVKVSYGKYGVAIFEDQLVATDMSKGGDSGSAVFCEGSSTLVGLLFAGSSGSTIINRIQNVMGSLRLSLNYD